MRLSSSNRKLAALCLVFAFVSVCVLYIGSGKIIPERWSNVLFPGFFLSAMLTVREQADFAKTLYVVVGLAMNAALYGTALFLVAKVRTMVRK
jgi:hypothetical protein